MSDYHHQQKGTQVRLALAACALVPCVGGLVAAIKTGNIAQAIWGVAVGILFAILLILFHCLTVRVSDKSVSLAFGVGMIGTSFLLKEVQSVTVVQNHWYNGWGIRYIRGGWLFNIAGLDAVEFQYSNGKRYRIGTDEPQRLYCAINSKLASAE